jgi:hypothetical protein
MRFIFVSFLIFACHVPASRAVETLRPDQLKSGMKGYGLSVFKGTQPTRFEVEVLGVLKNAFPKQDMILIRLSGADLEKTKVIAGMSGSPIYINDRLIGALAYGWAFENEPLAGVTPIHNMLAELEHAPGKERASSQPPSTPSSVFSATSGTIAAPRPLLTPLAFGGFSLRTIEMMSDQFEKFGLLPVAGGGASDIAPHQFTGHLEPGAAIGVQLIRGDLNATATGTITYIDKNKILAFGHPFFQGGRWEAPAMLAEVHTIMSSVQRSFKMASAVSEIGTMIGDWQSCIVADTKVKARMIPVTVRVTNHSTGHDEKYSMEVVDNEAFTPALVTMAIAEAITVTSGSSQETTVRVGLAAELSDRTIRLTDTFFNPAGGLNNPHALAPLLAMFSTPFGHPTVKRIEVAVDAEFKRQTAEIKRAYFSKAQVDGGEKVPLTVVLKPYGKPEFTKTIPIEVPPATETMRALTVTVMIGTDAPPDVAPPDNLNDYLNALTKEHTATELVAIVQSPTRGMNYNGKLLKQLPASVLNLLDDSSTRENSVTADTQQLIEPTDWVISGQATVRVPIRQE